MKRNNALFAPGGVIYTAAAIRAIRETGEYCVAFVIRHMCGDWGEAISPDEVAGSEDYPDIISRYLLPDGRELVVKTCCVHTPSVRWTELCLADELDETNPEEDVLPQEGAAPQTIEEPLEMEGALS